MKVKKFLTYFVACSVIACLTGFFSSANAAPSKGTYSKEYLKKRIVQEAKKQGLCPYLALSVARQESNFNCNAKSHAGAIGLFQLMPATARDLGVNPYQPDQNICGGIRYLKMMKDQFGSTSFALAAYNAGPGAVQKYGGIPPYRETQLYVRYIMKFYNQYKNNPDPVLVSS